MAALAVLLCLWTSADAAVAQPNILVILTDDQRAAGTMDVLPQTRALFETGGDIGRGDGGGVERMPFIDDRDDEVVVAALAAHFDGALPLIIVGVVYDVGARLVDGGLHVKSRTLAQPGLARSICHEIANDR